MVWLAAPLPAAPRLRVVGLTATGAPAAEAWPAGYFQKTAGAFAGEQLERPPQLPFEKREEW